MRIFRKRGGRASLEGYPKTSFLHHPNPSRARTVPPAPPTRPLSKMVRLERGAPRAVSIFRVAEELRCRGEEVVELFEKVSPALGGRSCRYTTGAAGRTS